MSSAVTDRTGLEDDAAARALEDLLDQLESCQAQLEHARQRAARLLEERRTGRPWLEIVTGESRPLVVESISAVLSSLATAGHAWRRQQAMALREEQVSINRIATLFGVTRQRISALLRETDNDDVDGGVRAGNGVNGNGVNGNGHGRGAAARLVTPAAGPRPTA